MSRRCRPPMLPLALAWGAAAALPARAATDLTRLVQEPGSDPIAVVTRDLPTWLAAAATEVAVGPGAPTAFVALKDDGSGQDVMAADGIAVATFDVDPADADLTIALRSADGTVLWQDTVPPARGAPAVVLELWGQEDRLRVGVHIAMPESTVAPDGSAPPVGGAAAGTDPRGGPPGLPSMPAATHLASMALSGLLAGLAAGWLLARVRAAPPWTRAAAPRPLPASPPRVLGLAATDPPDLASWRLARSWSTSRPVLVVARPPPDLPPDLPPTVQRFAAPRPPARLVRAAADQLAVLGRPAILVAGLDALEPVEPGEAADAAWRELVGVVGDRADLLLLLAPGEPGHASAPSLAPGAETLPAAPTGAPEAP